MDVHKIIDGILEMSDMNDSDKVYMFIQLCDEKQLLDELNKQAIMQKIDMAPESLVHAFVYGVLKIAKPYLFQGDSK